ncbi:hypothetical protein RND81_03G037700 [Saponaria officinalis]|uniref:Uncharacterized protein n=1 Tax=Saponaria officinalis TaxID=3572 RepID=A0AAW1M3N2_SAPOF
MLTERTRQQNHEHIINKASNIVPKLEEEAAKLILIVSKKEAGFVKLAGSGGARKEEVGIDVEIFECAPSIHFVEMKKSNGDTME